MLNNLHNPQVSTHYTTIHLGAQTHKPVLPRHLRYVVVPRSYAGFGFSHPADEWNKQGTHFWTNPTAEEKAGLEAPHAHEPTPDGQPPRENVFAALSSKIGLRPIFSKANSHHLIKFPEVDNPARSSSIRQTPQHAEFFQALTARQSSAQLPPFGRKKSFFPSDEEYWVKRGHFMSFGEKEAMLRGAKSWKIYSRQAKIDEIRIKMGILDKARAEQQLREERAEEAENVDWWRKQETQIKQRESWRKEQEELEVLGKGLSFKEQARNLEWSGGAAAAASSSQRGGAPAAGGTKQDVGKGRGDTTSAGVKNTGRGAAGAAASSAAPAPGKAVLRKRLPSGELGAGGKKKNKDGAGGGKGAGAPGALAKQPAKKPAVEETKEDAWDGGWQEEDWAGWAGEDWGTGGWDDEWESKELAEKAEKELKQQLQQTKTQVKRQESGRGGWGAWDNNAGKGGNNNKGAGGGKGGAGKPGGGRERADSNWKDRKPGWNVWVPPGSSGGGAAASSAGAPAPPALPGGGNKLVLKSRKQVEQAGVSTNQHTKVWTPDGAVAMKAGDKVYDSRFTMRAQGTNKQWRCHTCTRAVPREDVAHCRRCDPVNGEDFESKALGEFEEKMGLTPNKETRPKVDLKAAHRHVLVGTGFYQSLKDERKVGGNNRGAGASSAAPAAARPRGRGGTAAGGMHGFGPQGVHENKGGTNPGGKGGGGGTNAGGKKGGGGGRPPSPRGGGGKGKQPKNGGKGFWQ